MGIGETRLDQVGLDKTRWDQVLWGHVDIEHQALADRGDWMRSRAALFWDTLDRDPVTGWKTRVDICALFNSTVFGQGVPVLWWLIRQDGCCYWERQLGGFLFGTEKQPVCLKHFSRTPCWTETLFPCNFHICSFSFAASKVFKTLPHLLMYEVDRAGVVHWIFCDPRLVFS